jgi:hypothetical protein
MRQAFGLADLHSEQIEALARALLESDPKLRLLLVPHVHRPEGDVESDLDAARSLAAVWARPLRGACASSRSTYTRQS